jgi:hypothetical protein
MQQSSLNITSASVLGITDAQVTLERVKIDDNNGFTVSVLRVLIWPILL